MGEVIVLVIIALIFFGIYSVMKKDLYSEEYAKNNNWPMGEGVISSIMSESKGSSLMVEFTDGINNYWGKTFLYVGVKKKYAIGDKVVFWYRLNQAEPQKESVMAKLPGRRIDAILVLCNPLVQSVSSKQAKGAWIWFVLGCVSLVADVMLIIFKYL